MQKETLDQYQKFTVLKSTPYWFDDLGKRYLMVEGTTVKFLHCFRMLDCWLVSRSDETLMFICRPYEDQIRLEP